MTILQHQLRLFPARPEHRRLSRPRRAGVAAVVAAGLGALAGCRSSARSPSPGPSPEPGVLDVLSWSVVAESADLARALETASPPRGIPESVRERYRANGMRCFELTMQEYETFRGVLLPVGSSERLAIAEGPGWTTLVESPPLASGARLEIDSGPLRLPEGRIRLLGRAWREPVVGESGASSGVAMELAVEFETTPERRDFLDPTLPDESRRQRFSRLRLVGVEDRAVAYVIVPEDPRADWAAMATDSEGAPVPAEGEAEPAPGAASEESATNPPAPDEPDEPLGPFAARDATFGQVLLGPAPGSSRGLRRVIVLLPRAEGSFRLGR